MTRWSRREQRSGKETILVRRRGRRAASKVARMFKTRIAMSRPLGISASLFTLFGLPFRSEERPAQLSW
jgi:hypothetical protein